MYEDRTNYMQKCLCFVLSTREENALLFKNCDENGERGIHHCNLLAMVFINRMEIIWQITHFQKLNYQSMSDPAFNKVLLCLTPANTLFYK